MDRFIVADGCALRVRDEGRGPAIVLLHGYLESLEAWDYLTPLLVRDFRVIVPDLPGHGISQVMGHVHTMEFLAGVVRAVLDELGVERCLMVGHSMGGYAALAFQELYPERLSGIVLLHSTPDADSPAKCENRRREIEIVESGKKDMLAKQSASIGFAPQNRRRMAGEIEEREIQVSLTDDDGIVALLRGMMERPDRNAMFHDSKVPEMIILGRGDEYITPETAHEMIARHPQARVVWLENSGHMGLVEEPEKVADALKEFAAELR